MIKRKWRMVRNKFFNRFIQSKKLKFIVWFDAKNPGKYCWADCVSWAFSPTQWNPFDIGSSEGCEIESKEHSHKTCYCGGWMNGVCFAKLSKAEQQKIRDEQETEYQKIKENLPF